MTSQRARPRDTRKPSTTAINLQESSQCRWWADHFGVQPNALLAAILEVGVDARAVRHALHGQAANGCRGRASDVGMRAVERAAHGRSPTRSK